jgi:HD-GYP domain-containing protein (c-di-GMP phosphodiesterase class II)
MTPYIRQVAELLNESRQWSAETAARLSFLGFIVLPEPIIRRVSRGRQLSPEESAVYSQHAEVAVGLLANIPRMDPFIRIITYQEKRFDGGGWPEDEVRGEALPLESRIIKAVSDFEALVRAGQPKAEALLELKRRPGWYDPQVLAALGLVLGSEASYAARSLGVDALKEGMILAKDVFNLKGNRRLLARGQELSPTLLAFLKKYSQTLGVMEPIEVLSPVKAK